MILARGRQRTPDAATCTPPRPPTSGCGAAEVRAVSIADRLIVGPKPRRLIFSGRRRYRAGRVVRFVVTSSWTRCRLAPPRRVGGRFCCYAPALCYARAAKPIAPIGAREDWPRPIDHLELAAETEGAITRRRLSGVRQPAAGKQSLASMRDKLVGVETPAIISNSADSRLASPDHTAASFLMKRPRRKCAQNANEDAATTVAIAGEVIQFHPIGAAASLQEVVAVLQDDGRRGVTESPLDSRRPSGAIARQMIDCTLARPATAGRDDAPCDAGAERRSPAPRGADGLARASRLLPVISGPVDAPSVRQGAKFKREVSVHATSVLLALVLVAALTAGTSVRPERSGKLELWRALVSAALGDLSAANATRAPLERIAHKLAAWPSQRSAALIYLNLVAASQRRHRLAVGSRFACARVSLAELAADSMPERGKLGALESARARLGLDELGGRSSAARARDERANIVALMEKLNHVDSQDGAARPQSLGFGALANLAVENANLISRLLIGGGTATEDATGGSEAEETRAARTSDGLGARGQLLSRLASPRFFKYLLTRGLRDQMDRHPHLHALGLAFLDSGLGGRVEFAPLVRLELDAAGERRIRSVDLANASGLEHAADGLPPSFLLRWQLADEELRELAARLAGARPPAREQKSRGFLSSLLGGPDEDPAGAEEDDRLVANSSDQREALGSLALGDGRWFSPYFDCGLSQRWLLTYSVPFFGAPAHPTSTEARALPVLRGVAFVSLDLARTRLLDQCSSTGAFLANTHHCARLRRSQCVPTGDQTEVIAGAYVCSCPSNSTVASEERRANEEFRDKQTEALLAGVNSNASRSLDQLALELPTTDERLADKTYVANSVLDHETNGGNSNESGHYDSTGADRFQILERRPGIRFQLAGAQLESDAALAWFAELTDRWKLERDPGDLWPVQTCRYCLAAEWLNLTLSCSESTPHDSVGFLVRLTVLGLLVVCVALSMLLIGIILRVRKSKIVHASGWLMLETMLVGALLLYSSVLIRFVQPSSFGCLLEPWLRELGFSVFYGSILIKLYRILTEFQTRKAHRVCLRDKDQFVYLLAIVLIVVGYMGAWTALNIDSFLLIRSLRPAPPSSSPSPDQPPNATERPAIETQPSLVGGLVAPERLRQLAASLNSLGDLFSSLLESAQIYDRSSGGFRLATRCRKLTWDYVTESSELALLLFGLHLVYKLRNASVEIHKEKLILCVSVAIELLVSAITYAIRHSLWDRLSDNELLVLLCARCQLTVTLTLSLVFAPKLWSLYKSKQSLLFGGGSSMRATSGSIRHRCHISCELHDHHLNDAMRLQQAMLSSTALDIGSINLADMDPDEIQAEFKRVYTQLEIYKTKAMRRDNPHISKRRGGRKTGHRKFSLQAFHPGKHSDHNQQHHQPTTTNTSSSAGLALCGSPADCSAGAKVNGAQAVAHFDYPDSFQATAHNKSSIVASPSKLPVLHEAEPAPNGPTRGTNAERRVRLDDAHNDAAHQRSHIQAQQARDESLGTSSERTTSAPQPAVGQIEATGAGRCATAASANCINTTATPSNINSSGGPHHHHHCHHHHHHRAVHSHRPHGHRHRAAGSRSATQQVTDCEPTTALTTPASQHQHDNTGSHLRVISSAVEVDSQSSEDASPQRESSLVCLSQSSIHPEEASTN